jgi:hypothetical protein
MEAVKAYCVIRWQDFSNYVRLHHILQLQHIKLEKPAQREFI